jgi:phosphopantetheinyl transferase (holo-ACP synthase)
MDTKEIINAINELSKKIDKLGKDIVQIESVSHIQSQLMYNSLDAKLDIFKNLDNQSSDKIISVSKRRQAKPSFFKKLFNERRDEFINKLYTQEEIDEISKTDAVSKLDGTIKRDNKIAEILYKEHIKVNNPAGRLGKFESIYDNEA